MKRIIILLIILLFLISVADGAECNQVAGNMYTPPGGDRITYFFSGATTIEVCHQHSVPQNGTKIVNGELNETYLISSGNTIKLITAPKDPNIIDNILGVFGL